MSNVVEVMVSRQKQLHDLAMLYLKSCDLSNKTPKEIFLMYEDALQSIKGAKKDSDGSIRVV